MSFKIDTIDVATGLSRFAKDMTKEEIQTLLDDYVRDIEVPLSESKLTDQLVSFGEYLLSEERKRRISDSGSKVPLAERLSQVYHADIENWKELQKSK